MRERRAGEGKDSAGAIQRKVGAWLTQSPAAGERCDRSLMKALRPSNIRAEAAEDLQVVQFSPGKNDLPVRILDKSLSIL